MIQLNIKLHSKLTHFYNKFTRNFVLKHVDGFVSVSDELKQRFQYFNKPIEVIANGIDTSQYNLVPYKNDKPTFVFIGTPNQSWHGLDKIISMADHFQKYQFYIIGSTGKDTNNIKYFGYLSKDDSTKIIQRCDIGIATLSLYKKHLTEASPLKSRQYLACGIPIIYAYKDTDLEGKESFVLRLTNSENNINHTKIEQFCQ
jgi:glycosyltransferase involved in cell wall biosynthesis